MNNGWEVGRDYGYIYIYIYTYIYINITIYKYNEYITVLLCRTET